MIYDVDLDEDFVLVPLRSDARSLLSQSDSVQRAELVAPFANSFIGDLNTSLGQHLLDVAVAQSEAAVQPYALFHYFDRESVTTISAFPLYSSPQSLAS